MGPIKAKRSGCVEVAGIDVVFDEKEDVTVLAGEVSPEALSFLLSEAGPWEDVSEALGSEEKKTEEKLKAITKAKAKIEAAKAAKKAKAEAAKGQKVKP